MMDNKMWSIRTMEYYSAFKKKDILTPATTGMNLEDNMVNEIKPDTKGQTLYDSI